MLAYLMVDLWGRLKAAQKGKVKELMMDVMMAVAMELKKDVVMVG